MTSRQLWVIKSKSMKGSLNAGRDIYLMAGFEDSKRAYAFWGHIMAPRKMLLGIMDSKISWAIMSIDEFVADPRNRFYDVSGGTRVIHKISKSTYQMGVLDPLVASLIRYSTVIINVDDCVIKPGEEMVVHSEWLHVVPKINERVNQELLLDKGYGGSFLFQISDSASQDRLMEFITGRLNIDPNTNFLFVYNNPRIDVVRKTENYAWEISHTSVIVADDRIMKVEFVGNDMKISPAGQDYDSASTMLQEAGNLG